MIILYICIYIIYVCMKYIYIYIILCYNIYIYVIILYICIYIYIIYVCMKYIYIYTVYIMTILTTERTNQNSKKLLCLLLRCPTRRSVKDVPGNIRVGTRHCWSPTGAPSKVLTTGEGDGNDIKLWCDLQHPKQPWSRQLRILRADPNLPFVGLASSWFILVLGYVSRYAH